MTPILIAIVGGSASGKTTFARDLALALKPNAALLSLDAFYWPTDHLTPRQRDRLNFDHPRRIDWPLLDEVLDAFAAGRPAAVPRYDFSKHNRLPVHDCLLPRTFLVLEGLWLLRRRTVRRRCALRIFVNCPSAQRLRRRLSRDLADRGRTRRQILDQWQHQAEPGFRRFVAPQKSHADCCIRSPVLAATVNRLAAQLRALAHASP